MKTMSLIDLEQIKREIISVKLIRKEHNKVCLNILNWIIDDCVQMMF